jgi:hypothetical protein
MKTTTIRNIALIITLAYTAFYSINFWVPGSRFYKAVMGREPTIWEASGYKYLAGSNIALILMMASALFGPDLEKRRALRFSLPVFFVGLIETMEIKPLANPFWWDFVTLSMILRLVLSIVGGFVLPVQRATPLGPKHVVHDSAGTESASKTHQA